MSIRIGLPPAPRPAFKRPFGGPGVNPPAEPTLWEQLDPVGWRGQNFPLTSLKVTMSQDLVHHKYRGVDSARIEATGRAPMEITAEIPFVNGIVPGKGETWGIPYPTEFRRFLKSMADRTSAVLAHPELGAILCRPVSVDFAHDAQRRDGVIVTAKWVETLTNEDLDLKDVFSTDSPIKAAQLAALDLDASKDDILGLVPEGAFPDETFDSLVNKACGFVDSVTTSVSLLLAKPGQIVARAQRFKDSVERAKNVLTWPAIQAAEKLEEAARHLPARTVTVYGTGAPSNGTSASDGGTKTTLQFPTGKHLVPLTKKVARYVTPTRMTMAGLLVAIPGSKIDDLMSLNPSLVSHPEVPAGTVIRHYA